MVPFIREGIKAGEPCVSVLENPRAEEVRAAVGSTAGDDFLRVLTPDDAYLIDGCFDTDRMLGFWETAIRQMLSNNAPGVRAVGEMTWSLRSAPGCDQLIAYESRLNEFLPRFPLVILCLYDLEQFSGAVVMGMLMTHPLVLVNGVVRTNPYYLEPDEFLAAN